MTAAPWPEMIAIALGGILVGFLAGWESGWWARGKHERKWRGGAR